MRNFLLSLILLFVSTSVFANYEEQKHQVCVTYGKIGMMIAQTKVNGATIQQQIEVLKQSGLQGTSTGANIFQIIKAAYDPRYHIMHPEDIRPFAAGVYSSCMRDLNFE